MFYVSIYATSVMVLIIVDLIVAVQNSTTVPIVNIILDFLIPFMAILIFLLIDIVKKLKVRNKR